MDKNSAEYKTVMHLYEDGKISELERDKLLDALGIVGDEPDPEISPNNDKAFSHSNFDDEDDEDEDEEDDEENEEEDDDDDDEDEEGEENEGEWKFSDLGKKISQSVRAGLKAANAALDDAAETIKFKLNRKRKSGSVENTTTNIYNMPYEDMRLTLKIVLTDNKGRVNVSRYSFEMSKPDSTADGILQKMGDRLDEFGKNKLRELIEKRFTGNYNLVNGGLVLNVTVAPSPEL